VSLHELGQLTFIELGLTLLPCSQQLEPASVEAPMEAGEELHGQWCQDFFRALYPGARDLDLGHCLLA
jgi:hypothetical protein